MIWCILSVAGVVTTLRLLPFLFAKQLKKSRLVTALGTRLPACIILLQVAYTLKDQPLFTAPYMIPQVAGILAVVGLHLWKRSMILSIFGGFALFEALWYILA